MLLLCFSYAVQFSKNGFLEILMRGFYTSHSLSKLNSGISVAACLLPVAGLFVGICLGKFLPTF
jgi:hypothetical protein